MARTVGCLMKVSACVRVRENERESLYNVCTLVIVEHFQLYFDDELSY